MSCVLLSNICVTAHIYSFGVLKQNTRPAPAVSMSYIDDLDLDLYHSMSVKPASRINNADPID
jgi:hypothetical protein